MLEHDSEIYLNALFDKLQSCYGNTIQSPLTSFCALTLTLIAEILYSYPKIEEKREILDKERREDRMRKQQEMRDLQNSWFYHREERDVKNLEKFKYEEVANFL